MDPRNPHNAYRYQQPGQAAPIYIPPSHTTQRILPVPQKEGQTEYHYGMPGQASPIYIPESHMALSDRRSKEEIQRLSSQNDALTAALDQAHAAHGGESNLPPTEYPRLPSHTQFAPLPPSPAPAPPTPSPQQQQVMAQNARLMAPPARPLVSPPPVPQGGGFQRPQIAPPNLSALDEAYRNMGGNPQG